MLLDACYLEVVTVAVFLRMCVIVFSQASTSVQQGALLVRERQRGRLILLIENTLFLARP